MSYGEVGGLQLEEEEEGHAVANGWLLGGRGVRALFDAVRHEQLRQHLPGAVGPQLEHLHPSLGPEGHREEVALEGWPQVEEEVTHCPNPRKCPSKAPDPSGSPRHC